MAHTIRAVYENGVFRPLEAPGLAEHQQVRLTIDSVSPADEQTPADASDPLTGLRLSTGISDLAEHFDDYRFGRRQP
jgi:predicted DNA-binding antitoxin AbrB/MazE fold protein